MSNSLYDFGRESFAKSDIDRPNDTFRAAGAGELAGIGTLLIALGKLEDLDQMPKRDYRG